MENRERYDYKEFLRKFSGSEERRCQVDPGSSDYIFYTYGLEHYGNNMPLIEPLETKEIRKIEDLVIVIDTSMSCKGELMRHFLEEASSVLSESGELFSGRSMFTSSSAMKKIREDQVIHDSREMERIFEEFYGPWLWRNGFPPCFYLCVPASGGRGLYEAFGGLIYCTDGYGIFPVKMPPDDTVFVFMRKDYRDVDCAALGDETSTAKIKYLLY